MYLKKAFVLLFLYLPVLSFGAYRTEKTLFGKAMDLYSCGIYDRASELFAQIDDPLSKSYSVLCSVKSKSMDYRMLADIWASENPHGVLYDQIFFAVARNLFDEGKFNEAFEYFSIVSSGNIPVDFRAEYNFCKAYCLLDASRFKESSECFHKVLTAPYSSFTAPSQYFLGFMDYEAKRPASAALWFEKSAKDPRFASISEFYLVECHFLLKDYGYVIRRGEAIYGDIPENRRSRLSRMLSESYMVRGDAKKAKKYLENEDKSSMTRSDFFHAGTVLYSVGDWAGAIENFSSMSSRTDSLGQVANYQMGYAYVRKGNKIAALDAFNEAAKYGYDANVQEDAAFNYAKLAFDLNHDSMGFKAYLKRYSTSRKGEQIYSYIALASLVNKDYPGAIEAYDALESLNEEQQRNYSKANYLRACQLVSAGSWNDAMPYLKAAGFNYPRSDRFNQLSRYWYAEASFHIGKYSQARSLFMDLFNNSSLQGGQEGELLPYNIACCFYQEGNWSAASRWLDTYLVTGSGVARKDALLRRADCDFIRKDYKAAVLSYSNLIADGPDGSIGLYPYLRQGIAAGLAGDVDGKINILREVRNRDSQTPYYAETLYELGRAYLDRSMPAEALSAFESLANVAPGTVTEGRALIGKGMVYRNTNKYEQALVSYKSVVSMLPGSELAQDALLAIESVYQSMKQPQKYLEYMEDNKLAAGKTPEELETMYFGAAEQLYLAGNNAQAIVSLQKFIDSYPSSKKVSDAEFYLADSYRNMGDKEKAVEAYGKVAKSGAESSFAEISRLQYASLNYELERFDAAYEGYCELKKTAVLDANRIAANEGKLRSAFKARNYEAAISASDSVYTVESTYIKAKSLMACSRRDEALPLFEKLSADASSDLGAESSYILIQDALDQADAAKVESLVYKFSQNFGSQNYWLAKAYLALGDSFLLQGNKQQARVTYESIRDGYAPVGPDDDVPTNVKMRLEKLNNAN